MPSRKPRTALRAATRGLSQAGLMLLTLILAVLTQPVARAAPDAPSGWKALLIAGDDSEPVFANGVDEMRRRLLGYGVKASDITVLKAGARAPAQRASSDNIDAAFNRLEGPAGSGCFVFITSHGQPNGGLIMSDEEAYLPPDYLARRLNETCGARPTVVVASGCYTGQFSDNRGLATASRVILAAARADRPSFGCGVDFRYTFYDTCLLSALKKGTPWKVIARDTGACVEKRERREGFDPSRPQAVFGRSVGGLTAF